MNISHVVMLAGGTFLFAACSTVITPDDPAVQNTTLPEKAGYESLDRIDELGAVTVEVLPVNLDGSGDTLDFNVTLNTHSVELDMDLAGLSTLEVDSSLSVEANLWDADVGGHHVNGVLVFPATVNGQPILEGARTLTLTIRDVDVPVRVFTWELTG